MSTAALRFSASRGLRSLEAALWLSAGLVMLSAHVGAAAWMMREPPSVPSDDSPPAAIMIEFADVPEAMMTEENEISPDRESSDAVQPTEEAKAPEEVPPDEPVEEIAEVEPAPVEEKPAEELAELDNVEVPLPVAKPRLPEKKEIVKKEEPKKKKPVKKPRQQPQAESKAAVQAQAQVQQSNRTAARQTTSGLFSSSMTPAKWQSRLMAHLERRKKYPSAARARGEQGTVHVRFAVDDAGNVLSVALARSSGFPDLDKEVLALVRRASPVPAPPPGVNKTITAPVRFDTR